LQSFAELAVSTHRYESYLDQVDVRTLEADLRRHEEQLKAKDGSAICYSDQGSGAAILFLHGWMMSRNVWHFQLPLSAKFRIITMELRGHGESAAADFSYDSCLGDLAELLNHLNIDTAVVVGWSMGSQIAIKAANLFKERIPGCLLVGGTPRFCAASDYPHGLPPTEARGMAIRIKRDYRGTAGLFFKEMFSATETAGLNLREIAADTVVSLPPVEITLSALRELTDSDLRPILADISQPVLLVHGAEDKICLPGAAEFMAEQLPLATVKIVAAAGHAPFMSDPEMFNTTLTGFIRTVHGRY